MSTLCNLTNDFFLKKINCNTVTLYLNNQSMNLQAHGDLRHVRNWENCCSPREKELIQKMFVSLWVDGTHQVNIDTINSLMESQYSHYRNCIDKAIKEAASTFHKVIDDKLASRHNEAQIPKSFLNMAIKEAARKFENVLLDEYESN